MPATGFQSPFEQIVLTQAAISTSQMLREWLHEKEKAIKEAKSAPDEKKRAAILSVPDPDKGNTRAEIATNLCEAFKKDHTAIFKYASRYNKRREGRVFQVDQLSAAEEGALKKIFTDFAEQCYDEKGNRKAMNVEQAAAAMQRLYEDLKLANKAEGKGFVPLRYMRFPASYILTQLGSSEKWKDLNHGQGINFNRGKKPKPEESLADRFRAAFDGSLDQKKEDEFRELNHPTPYIHHYESFTEIAGYRFPCLKFGWGQTHLLTDNGYLIDRTDELVAELEKRLKSGGRADKLIIDLSRRPEDPPLIHVSDLIQTKFEPDNKTPRQEQWAKKASKALTRLQDKLTDMKKAAKVDGREIQPEKVTLVSMDIDLLTGLSMRDVKNEEGVVIKKSEVTRLGDFISAHSLKTKNCEGIRPDMPADLLVMSDFLALLPKPKHASEYNQRIDTALDALAVMAIKEDKADIAELIKAAKPHIKAVAPRVMDAVNGHFNDKKTAAELMGKAKSLGKAERGEEQRKHNKPRFFMTVGGAGSGKSNAEVIANEQCGKGNYVIAGLDHVRSMFDRQALNLATDNHNYDYKNVEQASRLVRAMVLERARKQGYHLLLDGSGIPYESRYAPIVAEFKKHDYKTNVLGFDRTLYVNDPDARKKWDQEHGSTPRKAISDVFLGQAIRLVRELRAMPVKMIATNYACVPDALLNASQDLNVDRFWLMDTNPKKMGGKDTSAKDSDDTSANDIRPYILSFTTEITDRQLQQLDNMKGKELKRAIESMQKDNKKIYNALTHDAYKPDKTDANKWDFKVVGKDKAKAKAKDRYRIEVITDSERYLGTLEKGLFNLEANGPEELFKLTRPMSFDVEGLFCNERGSLRMEADKNFNVDEWPQIPLATPHSLPAWEKRGQRPVVGGSQSLPGAGNSRG